MAQEFQVDVLVVGSGASGLAAAVSAERTGARVALATKGSLASCNSAKAQGGIQAAFGEDDSPEQHAEDVWRSSHETADRAARRDPDRARPRGAIHWLEEHGVEFTRENGGYRLARCGGATRKRLLQVGDRTGARDHEGAARGASRPAPATSLPEVAASRARADRVRAGARAAASTQVEAGDGRPRRRRPLLPRGEGARRADSTNHPGATGEVTQLALELGAEARDLDALQYHPNGGAWPETMQGYSIPETTRAYGAVLLNADGEEFTDSLGPARRGRPGDRRRGRGRARASRPRTGAPRSGSTRRGSPRRTPTSRCRTCCAATARPASTRWPSRSSPIPSSTTRTAAS